MRFAKGHGTGNDFLILPDPDDTLDLSPELVARLCDRRTGLGADGLLRAVRMGARFPAGGRPGRDGRPEVGHEGGVERDGEVGGGRGDPGATSSAGRPGVTSPRPTPPPQSHRASLYKLTVTLKSL